jgi:hypothetical protein
LLTKTKISHSMKKVLILLAAPVIIAFTSCGGSKAEEEVILPGMMKVQLMVAGDTLSMIVPDSAKGKMEIVEQAWGATEIKVGNDFQVSIEPGEGDVTLAKSDIAGDEVFKLQRYITDEPTLLFWESKIADMPNSNFHFYAILKPGKISYLVKDVESGEAYNEKAVQTMVDAAKSLKAKTAVTPAL